MPVQVRPFQRADRHQLTALINAHAQAVIPGASASVNTVLSQLDREPDEIITDPWVAERLTLVAQQNERIVAAAHLLRYFADERAGESYRDAAEIRWFVYRPAAPDGNPYWPDATPAAEALMAACERRLRAWRVSRAFADGALPVPGVYGVPEQWGHISSLYEKAGFVDQGATEVVLLADVADLPTPNAIPGMQIARSVGINGTRFSARVDGAAIAYLEVESLATSEPLPRTAQWADIGNLQVAPPWQRQGIATALLAHAAEWLTLAHVTRLLAYADQEEMALRAFLRRHDFREVTTTKRGWIRAHRRTTAPR